MNTADTVVMTILGVIGFMALISLMVRMADLADNLWIELVIIAVIALFIYLVARG